MTFFNFVKKNLGSFTIIMIRLAMFFSSDIYSVKSLVVIDDGLSTIKYNHKYSIAFFLFLNLNTKIVFVETKKYDVYLCYIKAILSSIFSVLLYGHLKCYIFIELLQILDFIWYYTKDKSEEDHGVKVRRMKFD